MSKRIGLPVTLKMRHDAHYVETLTSFSGASIGCMIPIDKIRPNPDQPRKHIGDVRAFLDACRKHVAADGMLVIQVPDIDEFDRNGQPEATDSIPKFAVPSAISDCGENNG